MANSTPKAKKPARVALPGSRKTALAGAVRAGKVPAAERLTVTVRVRHRVGAAAPRPAGAVPLSRDEFRAAHGASPADIQAVEDFANAHGLDVVQTSVSQRAVRLSGTVDAMQAAFGVRLARYEITKSKQTFRGRTGSINIPASLASIVEGVFGLDDRPQARPHFRVRPVKKFKPQADAGKPMTPVQVARLYHFPANRNGAGQCIAILELGGGFRTKDLTAYFKSLGIKKPGVTAVSVSGGHNDPDGPSKDANGEVMLDIEVAGAVAPAAKIAVYFAPNTDDGFLNALTTAVHDNVRNPSVISISWGAAEAAWTEQAKRDFDSACADATVMGITVTVAAGDHGAPDTDDPGEKRANADFPASSPHVLACGGTRLVGKAAGIASKTAWNSRDGWATGGGVSEFFPLPAFQASAGVPRSLNPRGKVGRGVPDVSGNADSDTGYLVRVDGQTVPIGGTSAVAPLWAGLIALLNQGRPHFIGFLAPRLYALSAASHALRDITVGDNGVNSVTGYSAKAGWDPCTGLGSPNGAKLLASL
jgi:kumamolisin